MTYSALKTVFNIVLSCIRQVFNSIIYVLYVISSKQFVLAIPGVKNADENELQSIASPPDDTHVYNVADFNIMSSIVEGLTRTVCEQVEQQDKEIKQSKEQ